MTTETIQRGSLHIDPAVDAIFARLPEPDYPVNYQPEYPDPEALYAAIRDLRDVMPVTNPDQIINLRQRLGTLVQREACDPLITLDYCAEPITLDVSAGERAAGSVATNDMLQTVVGAQTLFVPRNRGQYAKPRSAQFQVLPNGKTVVTYMGDSINSITDTAEARQPDPRRLVAGAQQAAEFEAALTAELGHHLPASHEALSLAYEEAFAYTHEGKEYGLSGDLLWVGERTRQLDGAHMAFASRIENPIGVKLGPNTTSEYLEGLQHKLNPANEAGRLVLMVRVGNDIEALDRIARGIKAHNENAVIIYDCHGSTETLEDGGKHRSVEKTVGDIEALYRSLAQKCLRLHGVNIEMAPVDNLHQCTDRRNQRPTEAPVVDPLFSRLQIANILMQIRHLLPSAV